MADVNDVVISNYELSCKCSHPYESFDDGIVIFICLYVRMYQKRPALEILKSFITATKILVLHFTNFIHIFFNVMCPRTATAS